jgi:hypothetical protein
MWKRRPDPELIEGWIERALELAEAGTAARAKALTARAHLNPANSEGSAQEALAIAEALDDIELRSFAYEALSTVGMARGDYGEGYVWSKRRLELVPQLTDPDHISLVYFFTLISCANVGELVEARQMALAFDEVTQRLSPHHRVHAAYELIVVEALAGRWEVVRGLMERAESAVAANAETPCALEDLALLLCALAQVLIGADLEARRLEGIVAGLGREGFAYRYQIDAEIAIARGDLRELERILDTWIPDGLLDVDGLVARLDGLVALERRADIEVEAPSLVIPGSYLEPFALRAIGWARRDQEAISKAIDRFDTMGLTWFADQTKGWGVS